MDTPWGQLAYRKRAGMPPAKPSDFNNEYKNIIATIVWNQRREGEEGAYAKKWTQKAIADNLIDIAAWKTYLGPWREAEAKIKEGEAILAEDVEGEESGGSEDISPIGDIDEDALASLGEDTGETLSGAETGDQARTKQDSGNQDSGNSARRSSTPIRDNIIKVQRIIGERPTGKWDRDTDTKLGAYVTAAEPKVTTVPEGLEWWRDWKNSAPEIKKISVGSKNMSFEGGANEQLKGNLDSLVKVLEFIKDARMLVNESLSRGSLIRKRYWGRY